MTDAVDDVISSLAADEPEVAETDSTVKDDTAEEVPEVADQEEAEVKAVEETAAQKVERLEKEVHAKQRRIDRFTKEKHQTQGEIKALRERQEQYERSIRQQNQGEDKPLTEQEIRRQAQEIVDYERVTAACNDLVDKGAKSIKDFNKKINAVNDEVPLMRDDRPTPIMREILQCDAPLKVIEYLAEHPEDADYLGSATPRQAVRKLALIEVELTKPKTRTVSAAPTPIKPINGGGRGGKSVDEMNPDEVLNAARGR